MTLISGQPQSLSQATPQQGHDASGAIIDSSTATFQADVLDASMEMPVLVDFWAPWCGPCRQLTPILEKVVTANAGKVKLVKINVDENGALSGQLGVQSIPAVFAFLGGRPVDAFTGVIPESEVTRFIQRLVDAAAKAGLAPRTGPEQQIAEALDLARQAIESGDMARAEQIYGAVLRHAPDTVEALVGLAGLYWKHGDAEGARQTLDMLPEDTVNADAEALRKAIALAEAAGSLGDPDALRARLAADPDDHQARFDLALIDNATGDKLAAAEGLIAIMRRDRDWNEDGARRQLLEFFEAWGFKDPATVKGRRLLSALLFS